MSRNIDVGLLRAFVAVTETGSVTRAAHLLNLTQAAVSQQLKRLEELFGVELFDRSNRTLRTTAAGERLLAHAQTMMTMNDALWGLMSKPHYEGEVRVGVPHDVVEPNIPPVLRRFDRAWPRVQVTLTSGITVDLLAALDARRARRRPVDRAQRPRRRRAAAARPAGLGRRARWAGAPARAAARVVRQSQLRVQGIGDRGAGRQGTRLASDVRSQRARRPQGDALRRHRHRADAAVGGARRT